MKLLNQTAWIVFVLLGCVSCNRKPIASGNEAENSPAKSTVPSAEPRLNNDMPQPPTSFQTTISNQLSSEPWYYVTNGGQKFKVLVTRQNDLVMSSKTVALSGKLKSIDRFSYNSDSTNPIEVLRAKADGRVIRVLFRYNNGKQTKIMIGTDGNQVPVEKQDEYLNE